MPMGCLAKQTPGPCNARTYGSTHQRAAAHREHLRWYWGSHVANPRGERRPWDLPAQHLNELGPRGYNYFALTQTDELREVHLLKMQEARRSPLLRDREALHTGPLHPGPYLSLIHI